MPAVQPYEVGSTVKSAERTLQLFEVFYERQVPMTVTEIAAALGSPQSSTSILLKSLRQQGYLVYDADRRRYFPSLRLSVIADWIGKARFPEAGIWNAMIDLSERFSHLVALAVRKELYYEVISVIPARTDMQYVMRHRELRPLAYTTIGQLLLSACDDDAARRILQRTNALEPDKTRTVNVAEALESIRAWRKSGFAYSEGHAVPGVSVLGVLLPQPSAEENLVLALVGPVDQFKPIVHDAAVAMLEIKHDIEKLTAARLAEPASG